MTDQHRFQMSSNSRFVLQRLRTAAIGETVEYSDLADAAGISIGELHTPIATARRILLREENMVFGVIPTVGLKRLSDQEIVGTSVAVAQKVRRAARRGVKVLHAVQDFSALSQADQMRHSASVSIFAAVAEMTTERSVTKIEKAAEGKRAELPFAQILDAFRSASR